MQKRESEGALPVTNYLLRLPISVGFLSSATSGTPGSATVLALSSTAPAVVALPRIVARPPTMRDSMMAGESDQRMITFVAPSARSRSPGNRRSSIHESHDYLRPDFW
jgi:hypothetical protein